MQTGTVKWFNPAKGYGFIKPDAGGEDVLVEISAVKSAGLYELSEGQRITYEAQSDGEFESVVRLKLISKAA